MKEPFKNCWIQKFFFTNSFRLNQTQSLHQSIRTKSLLFEKQAKFLYQRQKTFNFIEILCNFDFPHAFTASELIYKPHFSANPVNYLTYRQSAANWNRKLSRIPPRDFSAVFLSDWQIKSQHKRRQGRKVRPISFHNTIQVFSLFSLSLFSWSVMVRWKNSHNTPFVMLRNQDSLFVSSLR